jgi:hypothetical protein
MDRRHVEPGPRLYEGEPWLQVLLRYLREIRTENESLVDQTGIEPVTS